jgi:flagellar brake protein
VEFGDGHAIVSSVLEVRRDTNALVFDIARDVEANRHLFGASRLAFVSELDNIQIAFETKAASLFAFVDGPAAVVDMPNAVVRLQRREWFRATLPVQPPIRCTVLDHKGKASPAQAIDLSCGGTAMMVDDPSLADTEIGAGLELILSLPDVGPVALGATLRTVQHKDTIGGKVRLGFRFEKVVPKTANQIQRYVQQLEVNQLRVLRLRG